MCQFNPSVPRNFILLSVGVHGNETAPIEIIDQLVSDIFAGKIVVKQNLLIVIANLQSIKASCREVVENMNRLFNNNFTPKVMIAMSEREVAGL